MGAVPLQQRGKNKGKWGCRAVGERICQLRLWTCLPGFQLQEANSLPGLSSAQPSLAGFCSSTSAYVNYSNPVFSTHRLVTGLPMWKTPAIPSLNHFKSLEALHLH